MQFGQVDDYVPVNLEMSFLTNSLFPHHRSQIGIPFCQFTTLFIAHLITGNDILLNPVDITIIGTDQILYLPHINKVFGNVLLLELLRYFHLLSFLLSINRFSQQSEYESEHGYCHHDTANHPVQNPDTPQIESRPHFINKESYSKPPRQRSEGNGQIARNLFKDQYSGLHKSKTGKQTDEKKNNKYAGIC